ncbi:MAG: M23 family metallopeptidase [Acidobacteriota bacterium]
MRTFGILFAGWIVGAVIIVLLAFIPAIGAPTVVASRSPGRPDAGLRTPLPGLQVSAGGMAIPVLGLTTADLHDSYDQPRSGGRTHHALDILAPRGTPVIAAVNGTIRKLDRGGPGGLTIYQFDDAEARVFYYAHLERYAEGIAEGQRVNQGTVIGYVGTTGNAPANTPHLHFSVELLPPTKEYWKGQTVNPYPLLTAR